jgi:hypothetical protein
MELFRQTNIDFLKYKWWAIGASWALIAVGVFTIFVQKGLKFGIDFSGGTQIAIRFSQKPDIDKLRTLLDGAGLGEIGIQRYEAPEKNSVLVRVQQQEKEGRDVVTEVTKTLRQGLQAPADPSKIDINVEGKATLAARIAAADPTGSRGAPTRIRTRLLHAVAEKIIATARSSASSARPEQAASTEGISQGVKAWIQANTVTGPSSCSRPTTSGRRSVRTSRRRPCSRSCGPRSACSPTSRSVSAPFPSASAPSWRSSTTP